MTLDLIFNNARRLASLGHYRQALSLLREHSQKDFETSLLEGKTLAQQGSYQAALAAFKCAAESCPDSIRLQAATREVQALVAKGNRPPRSPWRTTLLVLGPAVILLGAASSMYSLGLRQAKPTEPTQAARPDVVTEIRSLLEQERASARTDMPAREDYSELLSALLKQQRETRAVLGEIAARNPEGTAPNKALEKFVQETQQTDAWLAHRIKQLEKSRDRQTHEAPNAGAPRPTAAFDARGVSNDAIVLAPLPNAQTRSATTAAAPANAATPAREFGITAGQRSMPPTP